MARKFRDLSEREMLAVAISLEEEDARIYADYADGLRDRYPDTARIFDEMRAEETEHRNSLMETYRSRFGEHIPLIRRQDVKGFIQRRALWLSRPLRINDVRKQVEVMELETRRFYERAVAHVTDLGIRQLLGDLAEVERRHYATAESLQETITPQSSRKKKMPNAGSSCCRLCNRDSPASWTARYRRSRRSLPLPLQPRIAGMLSSSAWPPRLAPAFPWPSLRPCPTTVHSPVAVAPYCVVPSLG